MHRLCLPVVCEVVENRPPILLNVVEMLRRSAVRAAALGFIGLGQMGLRMAPNAFKVPENTELYVYDVNTASMKQVAENCEGKTVHITGSPAEVAAHCTRIITMLPNGSVVKAVYTGDDGILSTIQKGTLVTDCSTIDTQTPKDLSVAVVEKGGVFCDAPVSGGINAAAAGILTFMVGAATLEEFEIAKILLAPFSKNTVRCGPVGSGQAVKICNNLILGQTMIAVSEAMLLGTTLGVDPKVLASVINTSTGNCWSSSAYNPYPGVVENVPSSRGYEGGFGAALMLKDLNLAVDAAKSVGITAQGGENAADVYSKMVKKQLGHLDFSGVMQYIKELKEGDCAL